MRLTFNSMDITTLLLMDELQQKHDKSNKNNINGDLTSNMSTFKNAQLKPDWNRIPSKNVEMSEEEFEEAIRALAFADAERRMKMGNEGLKKSDGKEILAGEMEKSMLLTKYISVVSPDRKAAYESFNGKGDTIYGNFNQTLLTRGKDGVWQCYYLTKEEMERSSKFGEIYINAMREYEAEHGQIPYEGSFKSNTGHNLYSGWAEYNPGAYYGGYTGMLYSALA